MLDNTIDTIRLFFRKDKEPYCCFKKILGFYPHNLALYEEAFIHKSYTKQLKGKKDYKNNERLEFLGDAILDSIVAEFVFLKYNTKQEGFLTNTRSKIVKRGTLNKVGKEIGLDKLIKFTTLNNTHNNYILGNAFEALIGAIYLDRGYKYCKRFILEKMIAEHLNIDKMAKEEVNFKSKLIEWTQKNKVHIEFKLVEQSKDEENNPIFETEVRIENISCGIGRGFSKRESQQIAAKAAHHFIKSDNEIKLNLQQLKEEREAQHSNSEENSKAQQPTNSVAVSN